MRLFYSSRLRRLLRGALLSGVIFHSTFATAQRSYDRGGRYGTLIENGTSWGGASGAAPLVLLILLCVVGVGFWVLSAKADWDIERELKKKARDRAAQASKPEVKAARIEAAGAVRDRGRERAAQAYEIIKAVPDSERRAKSIELYGLLARELGLASLSALRRDAPEEALRLMRELADARQLWYRDTGHKDALDLMLDDRWILEEAVATKLGRYPTDEYAKALDESAQRALGAEFSMFSREMSPGGLRFHFPHLVTKGKEQVLLGEARTIRSYFDVAFRSEAMRQEHAATLKRLADLR